MKSKISHHLALAQTFLFVPGNRPERFEKALTTNSHAVIIDLEDAVPLDEKIATRQALEKSLPNLLAQHKNRIVIRINAYGTDFFIDDLAFVSKFAIGAIIHPKTDSTEQLDLISQAIHPDSLIIPMIETASGVANLRSIARHPRCLRLTLGNIDLQADLGFTCDEKESEIFPIRYEIALATRLAEIASPIDGVTTNIESAEALQFDTLRSKRLGFGAKLCIHPKQVDVVISCFTPTSIEIEKAKRIVAADQASNGGAVKLDGRMVDRPVVLLAKKILKIAGVDL